MRKLTFLLVMSSLIVTNNVFGQSKDNATKADSISEARFKANIDHEVILDSKSKIISWIKPQSFAYDEFLHKRWDFIKNKVPNSPGPLPRSLYPQYYFYDGYRVNNDKVEHDNWMNDVGEKIPNWFESARLYYAYTGDTSVMLIVKNLIDYALEHGTSPASFAWPNFPHTNADAGEMEFDGFSRGGHFAPHETQLDHAGDMGLTYFRMYQFTGLDKYKKAALDVANELANHVREGSATKSPWPYRVVLDTGEITAQYGANWAGAYMLLNNLVKANIGKVEAYKDACNKVRDFVLQYPMQTGYWTDGHSDNPVDSHTYKSNMSNSNFVLYILDNHEFDPNWKTDIPKLIKWTEKYFVNRSAPGETGTMWGANIVGEQDGFNHKMAYQTARYAAECARWYSVTGDESYKEKAYRALNWVTYTSNSDGRAFESPISDNIASWWSDEYGEGPRMFYHAFVGVPEWAPPGENHILYSEGILKNVSYNFHDVKYTATASNDVEYLRLNFRPIQITINGKELNLRQNLDGEGFTLQPLDNGGYSVNIKRANSGDVVIKGS